MVCPIKKTKKDFFRGFVYYQGIENDKIISQIVRISKFCAQNGDRVLLEQHKLQNLGYKKFATQISLLLNFQENFGNRKL